MSEGKLADRGRAGTIDWSYNDPCCHLYARGNVLLAEFIATEVLKRMDH